MAHHKSAKKRIRRNERMRVANHKYISRIRTFIKKVEMLILSKDKENAKTAFVKAESELAKGAKRHLIHPNAAARKTSRLATKIKAL